MRGLWISMVVVGMVGVSVSMGACTRAESVPHRAEAASSPRNTTSAAETDDQTPAEAKASAELFVVMNPVGRALIYRANNPNKPIANDVHGSSLSMEEPSQAHRVDLPAGSYVVIAEHADYLPLVKDATLTVGEQTKVVFDFRHEGRKKPRR